MASDADLSPSLPDRGRYRVLHFADVINRYDFIDNVVRHLPRDRFLTSACTLTGEANVLAPELRSAGIAHHVLGGTRRASYPLRAAQLAALLRTEHVDVVHAHHFDPGAMAWLATRARRSTRLVIGRHYSDAIQLNSSGARRRARLAIETRVNEAAARIIVPSTMIRDLLAAAMVPLSKVDVIPYPFDPQRYHLPERSDIEEVRTTLGLDGRFVLGTFARLYRDKGHAHLLEALCRLPAGLGDVLCLFVGDGPDRAALVRMVEDRGLGSRVRFIGWRRDVLWIMGAVDAVVQPTLQEGFSQVMVEALWMAKGLVMTEVSGATDIIDDGDTGLLVAPGDPTALAGAIERLYREPSLATRMGRQGRARVERELTLAAVLPRYEESYARAMAS